MSKYEGFIPENVALKGAKCIGIYNADGNRVGQIPLGHLAIPCRKKLYSFGALADCHIGDQYPSDEADFIKALCYMNGIGVDFIVMNGDLTWNGTQEQLQRYKTLVDTHSPATPVFVVTGNHELYEQKSSGYYHEAVGHPMNYMVEYSGDVFLFLGTYDNAENKAFTQASLQYAYDVLEANRNKRCFVFHHVFPTSFGGAATQKYLEGQYAYDIWGAHGAVFETLLRHYKNTVLFHGHSHIKFSEQESGESENYSAEQGYHSVHIPSVTVLRDLVGEQLKNIESETSEGYVVDVYENGIHLRGRDFYNDVYLPIASYWIDTTLQEVEAGTFVDETGTISV